MIKHLFYALLCVASFSGCNREHLSVQTQYLNRDNLASSRVRTPDPMLYAPLVGQRLIISWALPKSYFDQNPIYLKVTIHFGNHTSMIETVPICQFRGTYVYQIMNEEFLEKEEIVTFKIDVVKDGIVLEEWRHQLWAELISVGENK